MTWYYVPRESLASVPVQEVSTLGGPLAKEYGWLADYLKTYKAATEVGQWPKEFDK